jgi:3-dehydroquinate synthase II/3-amino-4-hydroxybenzoic acid synthase
MNASAKKPIQLESVTATSTVKVREKSQIWYDTRGLSVIADRQNILARLPNFSYTGVLLHAENLALMPALPSTLKVTVMVESADLLPKLPPHAAVASADQKILQAARELGRETCLYQYVDDGESLHAAIHLGKRHPYLMICFRDPTNIPLELVIASLQSTGTTLIKEIGSPLDVDDAVVSLGVMEFGADGVMFSPETHPLLETFAQKLNASRKEKLALEPATIVRAVPVGMGYRSCIDLATMFSPKEGMIVGSTSQGGILCCPEVFFLPYMDLRPFRVNAGAVHSYVYNNENRTNYMTELGAGSSVMIVGVDGQTRTAAVGRMKTEMRPLRLLEARFESGEIINVIMQDDWHVRVFSPAGEPLNITELKAGDKVLAHKAQPGRHVGIKIEENILEN